MTADIEVSDGVFAQLEEVADAMDTPVATLVDKILRRWLKKNYEDYVEEEEPEEESNGDEDDFQDE